MLRAAVALCLLACSLGMDLDREWLSFKAQHGRQYLQKEELYRKQVFSDNLDFIRRHNLAADAGHHSYWVGVNEYADMTSAEFVRSMNGYRSDGLVTSDNELFVPAEGEAPATVDWRPKGYVTPVKNQLQCGSCWAFSTTGSLEGQHFKKAGTLVSLSEQNLVDCSKKEGNQGCEGGLMDAAFKYIKVNHGIDTEESYPYKAKDERCRFKKSKVGATLTSWKDIPTGQEDALKAAVAQIGPISVAIDASHQSFQLYKKGVYVEPACSSTQLDHGVLAAGYGTEAGKDYWLVKNSWGKTWGMEGYIMMARNHDNMCGIATQASYPIV